MGNKRNYGLPYMGSKSKIINFICDNIPTCDTFVDLFCGGGSVTHYMIEQNRYNNYICNDVNYLIVDLLSKAMNPNRNQNDTLDFISHDDFMTQRFIDGYIRYVWSFGNRGMTYIYSADKEPIKRMFHNALFYGDYQSVREHFGVDLSGIESINNLRHRMLAMRRIVKEQRPEYYEISRLQHVENINRINDVKFDTDDNIILFSEDYRNIIVPEWSVVYCDIPYRGTGTYSNGNTKFDYDAFYEYALKSEHPIFISEYDMPNDFVCVDEIDKKCQFKNSVGAIDTVERLYTTQNSLQIINDNPDIYMWNFKNGL